MIDIDAATSQAVETLLWSETHSDTEDGTPEPLDALGYTRDDVDPASYRELREAVEGFVTTAQDERPKIFRGLVPWARNPLFRAIDAASLGHDFILTANHHGAGFWDRGYGERGEWLTRAAQVSGYSLYVGDDGRLYVS